MLKNLLLLCFVLTDNSKIQNLKKKKTEYLIYHQEISNFNTSLPDNSEISLDFEFRKVDYGSTGNFCLEEDDIIKPFVYEISYSLNSGEKLYFDLLDKESKILFRCTIFNNNIGSDDKSKIKEINDIFIFTFTEGDSCKENIVKQSNTFKFCKCRRNKYVLDDLVFDAWVIGDDELLLSKLSISCEAYESLFLAISLKSITDKILIESSNYIKNKKIIQDSIGFKEYVLNLSRCFFAINNFIYKVIGVYQTINLTDEFTINNNVSSEEKRINEILTNIFTKSFQLLRISYGQLVSFINESYLFNKEEKMNIKDKISEILGKLEIYDENIMERCAKKTKYMRVNSIFEFNSHKKENFYDNQNQIYYFYGEYFKINKQCILMIFEEKIYDLILESLIKEPLYIEIDSTLLIYLQKSIFNIEKFINKPSESNLQQILKSDNNNELTPIKILEFLKNCEYKIRFRLSEEIKFVTDDFINYKIYLDKIIRIRDLLKIYISNNDLGSISINTIMTSTIMN